MKKTSIRVLAAALAALMMLPATASAAAHDLNLGAAKATIVSGDATPVIKGTSSWIATTVRADREEMTNVRFTVGAYYRGVEFGYPTNTGDHTSFYTDDTLSEGEIDYFAFRIDVPADFEGDLVRVNVAMEGTVKNKTRTEHFLLDVPVVAHTGADIEQVTKDLGTLTAGESRWVEVAFTGLGPSLDGFSTVVAVDGLAIIHPAEAAFTSLHHDDRLSYGETDVVRFKVDATDAVPGVYEISLNTNYGSSVHESSVQIEVLGG